MNINRLADKNTIEQWVAEGWLKEDEAGGIFEGYQDVVNNRRKLLPTDYAQITMAYEQHWLEVSNRDVVQKNFGSDMSHVRPVVQWLEAECPNLRDLTPDMVRGYLHSLRSEYAERTIAHRLTKMRQLVDQAVILGMISDNPARKVNLNQVNIRLFGSSQERRILKEDEINSLLEVSLSYRHLLSGGIPTVVRLGLYAGLRNQEMCWLKWDAVDWHNRIITVKESVCEETGETWIPKDYEMRRLDVKQTCIDYLEEERERQQEEGILGPFIMPGGNKKQPYYRNRPLHQDAPQKAFVKMSRAEGMAPEITIYSLRHTYATMGLRSGVDLRTLQKRMGHSDIKTTMEYLHYIEPEQHPMDRLPY